jgi:hypothetical protein
MGLSYLESRDEYPKSLGEVWEIMSGESYVAVVVVELRSFEPAHVAILDSHGYSAANPSRLVQWAISKHNGWRRIA